MYQPVHSVLLGLDRFNQFELGSAAIEVMAFAMHLVIRIARQIVRQESDALLEGDQFTGEGEVVFLFFRKKTAGF